MDKAERQLQICSKFTPNTIDERQTLTWQLKNFDSFRQAHSDCKFKSFPLVNVKIYLSNLYGLMTFSDNLITRLQLKA